MGFEQHGSAPDPINQHQPVSVSQSLTTDEGTEQQRRGENIAPPLNEPLVEPVYREHVSRPLSNAELPGYYSEALPYQPTTPPAPFGQPYQAAQNQGQSLPAGSYPAHPMPPNYPYAAYPPGYYQTNQNGQVPPFAHPGYPPAYYPYPYYYPYDWPPKPKRDTYQFTVSLITFICSILVLLGGIASSIFLTVTALASSSSLSNLPSRQVFSSLVLFTALAIAGLAGGGFSIYHSVRALFLKKTSAVFKLPPFWIFLICYGVIVAIGISIATNVDADPPFPLSIALIALAGILPALTFLALAVRRIHFPKAAPWITTWRRFTLAIVSGATLAIILATIFELILTVITVLEFRSRLSLIDNPDMPTPHNPQIVLLVLIVVAIIAPLVEEAVKPLAVIIMIGRLRSAAEAFVLGMSCGIGFDLIETSGYIGNGGNHYWIYTAMERSTAGLLHGFGAGMVGLGWYYLTHKHSTRNNILLGIGCGVYAVLQHAIWNGSFVLQLLPAPVGPYLENGTISIGSVELPAFLIVYLVLSVLILTFLLFVTGKLRRQQAPVAPPSDQAKPQPDNASQQPVGV